ncbi:MAG: diguanylate cyclase (GGDEF)-like protein [Sulfurimonas sp.]|jgi:diguanylate cyclase (GGDEF)-like protein|uniref:diguanylate cyclase n=1 Tax=Sulfurimonas sp. TaxID=2022749 RepID=UPI0039E3E76A
MEKILIVEDNKTLAKLIARKITETLKFEVDIAYTLQEAKLFLKAYTYFITLLDVNLPDAPHGEVIDYVLSKKQHVIVLSANVDKEFRKKILQKEIIDYVIKGGMDDINYIIQTIDRLYKNKQHKVLVVDDSMVTRKHMKTLLQNLFFNVITVAHGEEAIGMLETHSDISLVLTDYNMPVMNGLDLTREVRKSYTKNELSIIALSSSEDSEINAMFLKHGANDYISKPFSKEEFSCRINNTVEARENLNLVTNHINRDYLTGLYNRAYFFAHMNDYRDEIALSPETYALAMINIDNFKMINDTYGHETGDNIIIHLSEVLISTTNYRDMVARFSAEEFCVVLKNVNRFSAEDIFERLRKEVQKSYVLSDNGKEIQFTISVGVTISGEESLQDNIDQADMMLYKAKQEGRNQVILMS